MTHRQMRPHELARKDQGLAAAADMLQSGGNAIVMDEAPPGKQCCWCSCPPEQDDRHARPGYVCPYMCHTEAIYLAAVFIPAREPRSYPLCALHRADFDRRVITPDTHVTEPWCDDDYLDPAVTS